MLIFPTKEWNNAKKFARSKKKLYLCSDFYVQRRVQART